MKTTTATPNALQTLASMATATADRLTNWLTTRHDLSNEEGEIFLTGWQLIALYSGVTLAALLLSINW